MLREGIRLHHNFKVIKAAAASEKVVRVGEQSIKASPPSSLSCCVIFDNSVSCFFIQSPQP